MKQTGKDDIIMATVCAALVWLMVACAEERIQQDEQIEKSCNNVYYSCMKNKQRNDYSYDFCQQQQESCEKENK